GGAFGHACDITLSAPVPPPPLTDIIRQQTVHRVRAGYADVVTCWVRTESGVIDLSGRSITAEIRSWGGDTALTTLPGTATDRGKATITMPTDLHHSHLTRGLHRIDVLADGAPVYTAVLEIV